MNKPFFSVVIPLYNKEQIIGKTIQSVLNQLYQNFEIVVVDDGCTDKSVSLVEKIKDERIKIIRKKNGGVSSARNLGIQNTQYNWIVFLDADDYWDENHLLNLQNVLLNQKTEGFVATGFYISNKKLEVAKTFQSSKEGLLDYFEVAALNGFPVHTSSTCIKRELLLKDSFNEQLSLGEDNELFARLGRKYKVFFITQPTSYYISDSENKEVSKTHDQAKDFLYQIKLSDCKSKNERRYYTIFILHHLFRFLLLEKNSEKAKTLFRRYSKDLKINDYIHYIIHKLRK